MGRAQRCRAAPSLGMPVLLVGSINIATAQDRRDALEALQRERLQALRGAQARSAPQWQPTAAALAWLPPVDGETPCFAIQDFELVRETPHLPHDCGDRFSCLLQDLGAFVGACLGPQSLDALPGRVRDARSDGREHRALCLKRGGHGQAIVAGQAHGRHAGHGRP